MSYGYNYEYGYGVGGGPPPFDGGLFVNGGFEDSLVGWQQVYAWTASVDAFTAENPATSINELLFQNFTLEDGATYEISADRKSVV